jgi:hypothetical protein
VVDFSGSKIDHNLIDQFVYKVTPVENDTFYWFINMNGKGDVRAKLTANGYKANCSIQLEEIERISSLHKDQSPKIVSWEKSPLLMSVLHRLLSTIRSNLIIDFQKGCHAFAWQPDFLWSNGGMNLLL